MRFPKKKAAVRSGACSWCGKDPADGFAAMSTLREGTHRYCHGDGDATTWERPEATCYELATRAQARGEDWVRL